MNRRDFLKIVGITAATSTAALYGCGSKEGSSEGSKVLGPIPTDKMTYRSFPGLGSDKVSILGYGCIIGKTKCERYKKRNAIIRV